MPRISISKIKTVKSQSRETICYTATIELDGVPAALAENDGQGGSDRFYSRNGVAIGSLAEIAKGEYIARGGEPFAFSADGATPSTIYLEALVGELVGEFEVQKSLKKLCKSKLVFRLPTDPEGEWRTLKGPYSPATKAFVLGKYPTAIIANEIY